MPRILPFFRAILLVSCAALGVVCASSSARAQTRPGGDGTDTARGLGMGIGARASAMSTSALAYNPANLTLARVYHIDASTGYEPQLGRLTFQSALVDSYSGPVAAGLSFRGLLNVGGSGYSGTEGRAAVAIALGEFFSVGAAGRYVSLTPAGGNTRPLVEQLNVDVALRVTPVAGLHFVGLANNLIDAPCTMSGFCAMPRTFGGGVSYTYDGVFTIGADVLFDTTTPSTQLGVFGGGGVEWLAGGTVPIRAGYAYDHLRVVHTVTAGLGYVDPKFGVDFGLRQDAVGGSATTLMLSVRYFVQ